MRTNDEIHDAVLDVRHQVLGLREDFIDLKKHVNDELEVQKEALVLKADKSDLTLLVLWKQSPIWLKIAGAAITAGMTAAAFVARLV